jgi:hypothetical protein
MLVTPPFGRIPEGGDFGVPPFCREGGVTNIRACICVGTKPVQACRGLYEPRKDKSLEPLNF